MKGNTAKFAGRLRVAVLVLAVLPGAFVCQDAFAQAYPGKPVRIIVPYAAGGPLDDVARVIGQRLNELWGQAVIVDNRGGAGGSIGADAVAKSVPDGYTLLLGNAGPITINPSLHRKLPYDPQKDLVPVTLMVSSPMVLVVHPSLPVNSVRNLVALAKSKPGQLNYASAGIGNLQHLGMESLQAMAGIRLNHVPYKGAAPAFVDLIAGQVELMFANIVGVLPHVKSMRVRALAVSSAKRSAALPDVPSVAEAYPDFDVTGWMGIFAPAGTSREIVAKVSGDIVRVLGRPDIRERFAGQGAETIAGSPDQLASFVRKESALYAGIIKSARITAE
jgi:tripartite-type tricarboxylate transporter receptor subunit TctC